MLSLFFQIFCGGGQWAKGSISPRKPTNPVKCWGYVNKISPGVFLSWLRFEELGDQDWSLEVWIRWEVWVSVRRRALLAAVHRGSVEPWHDANMQPCLQLRLQAPHGSTGRPGARLLRHQLYDTQRPSRPALVRTRLSTATRRMVSFQE